jgi:mannose-6-phosphate isomerase-like protein (cupin superfamily)
MVLTHAEVTRLVFEGRQPHPHPMADEFFLVLQGGGEHLTKEGPVRLNPGDLAYPWGMQMEVLHMPRGMPYEKDTDSRLFGPCDF